MSFKKNGNKRDIKMVMGAVFLLVIAILLVPYALLKITIAKKITWIIFALVVGYFGVTMFRNSNE